MNTPLNTTLPSVFDVDLVGPAEVMAVLAVDQAALLDLVNTGTLAAYRIGDVIRFRALEVAALAPSVSSTRALPPSSANDPVRVRSSCGL